MKWLMAKKEIADFYELREMRQSPFLIFSISLRRSSEQIYLFSGHFHPAGTLCPQALYTILEAMEVAASLPW